MQERPSTISRKSGPSTQYGSISIRGTFRAIQGLIALLVVFLAIQGMILWRVCHRGAETTRGLMSEGLPSLKHLAALGENLALYRLYSYELMFVQQEERKAKASEAVPF